MDIKHLIEESELSNHIDTFTFSLEAGKNEFKRMLEQEYCSSIGVLKRRQETILELRNNPALPTIHAALASLKSSETILLNHNPSETATVAEGQIFFQGEHTKSLNFIPYFLVLCVFLKVWIAPILALLSPLILAIMPYVIMTSVMDMHITWDMYTTLMKQMVLGVQSGEPWKLKHYGQAVWTLASLGQSMITPFMTSYHTSKLDAEIVKRGEALVEIHRIMSELHRTVPTFQRFIVPDIPTEPHEAAAWMNVEPLGIQQLWKTLGKMTVYSQLALDIQWTPVVWSGTKVQISEFSDLAIKRPALSTVTLKGHSLLTGPNRGGKSSNLRAILQKVLLGQVTGFTYKATASWTPFKQIFTRLKSRDTAGKESLFEMEVRFASTILKSLRTTSTHTLVLIDELFHSTNPPDAETSAKLFLQQLWNHPSAKSMISTHIFSLCETPQKVPIQSFCCNAKELPDGTIQYSYTLTEGGTCRVSSVREVLTEAGFYTRA
jgi:hypothetical protein